MKPILLIGGHGITGRKTAQQLRLRHPHVPLAIAGRNLAAAQAFAEELGNASAYAADISGNLPDLGLPHNEFSAMAVFLMDETGDALRFASDHAIPYVAVTGGAFEMGLQFAMGMHAMDRCSVTIASNWFCGGALMATLALCGELSRVEAITAGIVIDRNDGQSGPATRNDFERILGTCTSMPLRAHGIYKWITGDAGKVEYIGTGGRKLEGTPAVSVDAVAIGAATGARDVSVLETWGDSLSWVEEKASSDEIVIEARGTGKDGNAVVLRQEVVASRETAPITAITIAMLLDKAAGLSSGVPLAPGIYTAERALDPGEAVGWMNEAGVRFGPVSVRSA